MTLIGFDYTSDWNFWTKYHTNGFVRSSFAPFTYTTYIDICSDKLTQYQKVRDSSSKTNSRNNIICRLFIADENSVVPTQNYYYDTSAPPTRVAYPSYLAPGSVPFIIHRQFQSPKTIRWNKEAAIDWIDIKLYDDTGNPLALPNGALPDFQITFKASED
jgi:hypothetical protein